jgi:hypothetical protein
MSKLADLLRHAMRAEPAPLGFGSSPGKAPSTMLLVALVGERWAGGVPEAVSAGADVLLLTGQPKEKELKEAVSAAEGRPCGLQALEGDADQLSRVPQTGLDFLVLGPQAPASVLQDEERSYVFHLREELTDAQLRSVGALSVDALYLESDPAPLTIGREMELQRIGGLARRPLLLPVGMDAQREDLLSLREAGGVLLAVDLRETGAADGMRRLSGLIEALPPRRRRRLEVGREVTLLGTPPEAEEEDEDEEGDE